VIDPMSGEPVSHQLANLLRQRIVSGELAPGSLLPSQADLVKEHGLSRGTVAEAFDILSSEGLITMARGRGTFVRPRPTRVRHASSARYAELLSKLAQGEPISESAFTRDLAVPWSALTVDMAADRQEAANDVAKALGLASGTPVVHRRMIYRVNGAAEQIRHEWFPAGIIRRGSSILDSRKQPVPGGSIRELADLRITIAAIDETITTRMPSPDETSILRLHPGTPVFETHRVGHSDANPVAFAILIDPGDRTQLHYHLDLRQVTP
jgi:GntR family transcriptional regulator